jgi:glycosyltransferase involved in cell wall biosynthesis
VKKECGGVVDVSVVMPVYNAGKYLRSAVQSVLAQTFTDFELIAVDDGSKDESLAILREFEAKDPRVKVISRANTGIVGALNDGLAAAKGELIARMDADDLATPHRFEKQVAFLREHPDHVLVGSQVMLIDSDDAALCPKRDTVYEHEEIDAGHLSGRWPLVHPTVMMRRDAVMKVGGYRAKYQWLEDLDLFLRLAEVGQLASLRDVLLHYRLHTGSVCHTRENDQDKIRPELEAEVYARRGIAPPAGSGGHASRGYAESAGERLRVWGWFALLGGNVATGRKYALRALRAEPFAKQSWRLVYCAIRGY